MAITTVKRLAAEILDVGISRIRISSDGLSRAREALTRQDVRNLIQDKVVYKQPVKGRRKKSHKKRKREGRIRGQSKKLRKKAWMEKVRAQRKFLRTLLAENKLDKKFRRVLYAKIKSGMFRNKAAMAAYIEENDMLIKGEKK